MTQRKRIASLSPIELAKLIEAKRQSTPQRQLQEPMTNYKRLRLMNWQVNQIAIKLELVGSVELVRILKRLQTIYETGRCVDVPHWSELIQLGKGMTWEGG